MSIHELSHKLHSIDFPVLLAGYVPAAVHFTIADVNQVLVGVSAIASTLFTIYKWRKERKK